MKVVVVVDMGMALWQQVNAAAVLGIAVGAHHPEVLETDVRDASGVVHRGLARHPVPVLQATQADISRIFDRSKKDGAVTVIDFNSEAQRARDYEEYRAALTATLRSDLTYLGVALVGPQQRVDRYTGNLRLIK